MMVDGFVLDDELCLVFFKLVWFTVWLGELLAFVV
jgi:hypothetical protein